MTDRVTAAVRRGMGTPLVAALAVSASIGTPIAASAQTDQGQGGGYITKVEPRTHERIVFTQNVGYVPPLGHRFSDDAQGRLADGRSMRVIVDYNLGYAMAGEFGAIVMLNRKWGVGLTLGQSYFDDVEVSATVRTARGEPFQQAGRRKETAGHLELTRVLIRREGRRDPFDPDTRRPTGYLVRVFGGPAYYRAKQDILTLRANDTGFHEGSGFGYHAGLDASMFTGISGLGGGGIGFGGTIRYSRGSVRLPGLLDDGPSDRSVGGWNIGGGIRFRL